MLKVRMWLQEASLLLNGNISVGFTEFHLKNVEKHVC